MDLVRLSAEASLVIQFLACVLNAWGLMIRIRPEARIFRTLLMIELIVQVIEFIAYIGLLFLISQKQSNPIRIMSLRYIDWSITTPTMLITLMAYLSGEATLAEFWCRNKKIIATVIVLDWIMIICGYINEASSDKKKSSAWIWYGFIAFFVMFGIIYRAYREEMRTDREKRFIYSWFLILWALYGVAAFFDFGIRNTGYNILDVFSKNITGVFLVWKLNQNRA